MLKYSGISIMAIALAGLGAVRAEGAIRNVQALTGSDLVFTNEDTRSLSPKDNADLNFDAPMPRKVILPLVLSRPMAKPAEMQIELVCYPRHIRGVPGGKERREYGIVQECY